MCIGRQTYVLMSDWSSKQAHKIIDGDHIMNEDYKPVKVNIASILWNDEYVVENCDTKFKYSVHLGHTLVLMNDDNMKLEISVYDYLQLNDKDKWYGIKKYDENNYEKYKIKVYETGYVIDFYSYELERECNFLLNDRTVTGY